MTANPTDSINFREKYWVITFALAIVLLSVLVALKANTSFNWSLGLWLCILFILLGFKIRLQPLYVLFFALPPALIAVPGLIGIPSFPVIVVWLVVLLTLWYIQGCTGEWKQPIIPTPFLVPAGLYCIILILSIFFSSVDSGSFTNLCQCIAFFAVYWMLAQVIKGRNLHRLIVALLLGFIAGSIVFLIAFTGGSPQLALAGFKLGVMRPFVLGFNANFWGYYPMVGLPLLIAMLLYGKLKTWLRLLLVPVGLLMITVAIINMSRSALVGIAVSTMFLLLMHRTGRRLLLLFGITGLVLMILYLPAVFDTMEGVLRLRSGLSGREHLWPVAWEIISDHPIFGLGPTNFRKEFFFNAPPMKDGLQKIVTMPSAHNLYLNVGAEIGIFGPLLILSIFTLFAARSIKLWGRLKSSSDFVILVAINAVIIAGFCRSIFETDFLFPHGYITHNLILITLLAIQDQLYSRHLSSP